MQREQLKGAPKVEGQASNAPDLEDLMLDQPEDEDLDLSTHLHLSEFYVLEGGGEEGVLGPC